MSDLHGYDAWDEAEAGGPTSHTSGPGGPPQPPEPRRRPGAAPLVLVAAAVLLVVGLVVAMSALRPGAPEMAATARPPETAPTVVPTTGDRDTGESTPLPPATAPASSPTSTPATTPSARGAGPTTEAGGPTVTVTSSGNDPGGSEPASGDAALNVLNAIATREQGRRPRSGQIVVQLQNRSVGSRDAYITPPSGGPAWTAADILAYHTEASARAGGATLLKDGDRWISATWNPAWRTRQEAINWCYVAYPEFGRNYEGNSQLRSRCYVTNP